MEFHRRRKVESNIDMTPMIDTLLQLFVVFLLSMSFVASAVRLELPKASVQQQTPEPRAVVSLDAAGKWYVNDEATTKAELPARLQQHLRKMEKREVLLKADGTLVYEKVMEALIEVQRAGVSNVLLAYQHTEPK